jgi:hypothetical protein
MAVVRLTDSVITDISASASRIFAAGTNRLLDEYKERKWGDRVYDVLFATEIPIVGQLPMAWFRRSERIRVAIRESHESNATFNQVLDFSSERPFPNQLPASAHNKASSTDYTYIPLLDSAELSPILEEIRQHYARVKAAEMRANQMAASVKELLSVHSTLAPALKQWPPLWDLLPEKIKERHKAVVARGKPKVKPEQPVAAVDLNSMTAAVIANKITQGSNTQ